MDKSKKNRKSVSIEDELYFLICAEAAKQDTNFSKLICRVMRLYLKQRSRAPKA